MCHASLKFSAQQAVTLVAIYKIFHICYARITTPWPLKCFVYNVCIGSILALHKLKLAACISVAQILCDVRFFKWMLAARTYSARQSQMLSSALQIECPPSWVRANSVAAAHIYIHPSPASRTMGLAITLAGYCPWHAFFRHTLSDSFYTAAAANSFIVDCIYALADYLFARS